MLKEFLNFKTTHWWKIQLAIFMLVAWGLLTYSYVQLSKTDSLKFLSNVILFLSQITVDSLIVIVSIFVMRRSPDGYKKIFFYVSLAFIVQTVVDFNVNFTIYLTNNYPLTTLSEVSIEIPFFIFQILLLTAYIQ